MAAPPPACLCLAPGGHLVSFPAGAATHKGAWPLADPEVTLAALHTFSPKSNVRDCQSPPGISYHSLLCCLVQVIKAKAEMHFVISFLLFY